MEKTKHTGFMLTSDRTDGIIRDSQTGQPVDNFSGICRVYMGSGYTDFETYIESETGERSWKALNGWKNTNNR